MAPGLLRRVGRGGSVAGGAALGRRHGGRGAAALAKAQGERQGDPVPRRMKEFGWGIWGEFTHLT